MGNRAKVQRRNRKGEFADEGSPAVSAPSTPAGTAVADAPVDLLVSDESAFVRADAASNPNLTEAQMVQLSTDPYRSVCESLAGNPSCPPDVLDVLAKNKHWSVRCVTAQHPSTRQNTLVKLSEDNDDIVCHAAIRNPNHPDWKPDLTYRTLAGDPNTPPETLHEIVAEGPHDIITRCCLAGNPSTPPEAVDRLLQDHHTDVRASTIAHPNLDARKLKAFVRSEDIRDRAAAARNPTLPVHLLEELGNEAENAEWPDDGAVLSQGVAANPNTPTHVLARLPRLRGYGIANHPNTSDETLAELSCSDDSLMRWSVARRQAPLPERVIREMVASEKSEDVLIVLAMRTDCPPDVLETLADSDTVDVPHYVGGNPATPKAVLRELAQSPSIRTRQGVAKNPSAARQP